MKIGKPSRSSLELSKFDRFKDSKKIKMSKILKLPIPQTGIVP